MHSLQPIIAGIAAARSLHNQPVPTKYCAAWPGSRRHFGIGRYAGLDLERAPGRGRSG